MRNKKRIGRLKIVNLILNFDIELCTVKGESKLNDEGVGSVGSG